MKSISLKPAGTAINFLIRESFSNFLAKFDVAIATISAGVSFAGLILDSDPTIFAGTLVLMAVIYPSTNSEKGGES